MMGKILKPARETRPRPLAESLKAAQAGDHFPHIARFYLERAAECERLADQAVSEDVRRICLTLAARWRSFVPDLHGSLPDQGGNHR